MVDNYITEISETSLENTLLTIGIQLREARREAGYGVADVANTLRINTTYISAIENGDVDTLPSSTYIAGFLRSYGRLVGFDGNELARTYLDRVDDADRQPTYSFPQNNVKPQRSGAMIASITVVLAVAGYAGWYWTETKSGDSIIDNSILATVPVTPKLAPGVAGIGTPATIEPDGTAQNVFAESQNDKPLIIDVDAPKVSVDEAPDIETFANSISLEMPKIDNVDDSDSVVAVADQAQALSETVVENETQVINVEVTDTQMASNDVAEATDDDPAVLLEGDSNNMSQSSAVANQRDPLQEITIRATGSSWVEIIRNNGEEVMTQLMRDGDTYVVDGAENLYLSTGNAGGIEFIITDGDAISAGAVGEIVRDLPLNVAKLRARL
jgi:cytoskeletal protein RodZ